MCKTIGFIMLFSTLANGVDVLFDHLRTSQKITEHVAQIKSFAFKPNLFESDRLSPYGSISAHAKPLFVLSVSSSFLSFYSCSLFISSVSPFVSRMSLVVSCSLPFDPLFSHVL
jgi:hypothetical protein